MSPMTDTQARVLFEGWADVLAGANYEVWFGFDSDGPILIMEAVEQGNVLRWLL